MDKLLFAHALTGCDTTSGIYKFGKTSIFKRLQSCRALLQLAAEFYKDNLSPEDVGNTTIRFFERLHSKNSTLAECRKQKYNEMVLSDKSRIDPSNLPPSPRAAFHHGLRVYHQITVWRTLSDSDIEPLKWGWKVTDDHFVPIATDKEAGPQDLLKIIRCGCRENCDKRCSCRKAGLECSSYCKECRGVSCTNARDYESDESENELVDDERHFLDAFN